MPRRVDIHHHIFPPWIDKATASADVGFRTPPENLPWTPDISLRAMDRLGIDLAALSYPAGMPGGPPGDANRSAARRYNEYAAQLCKAHPGRFAFFACTPNLFDVQGKSSPLRSFLFGDPLHTHSSPGAIDEIRFALDELNASGVSLPSLYGEGQNASKF